MNRHNYKWNWLLALGLILFLIIVQTPVEGASEKLAITGVDATAMGTVIYTTGTATYTGAPPTFTARFLKVGDLEKAYDVTITSTTWDTPTDWRLGILLAGIPNGRYLVEVTGTFSSGHQLVDVSEPAHFVPVCNGQVCTEP
jgi:hypothetical protein